MSSRVLRKLLLLFALFAITLPVFFCNNPATNDKADTQPTSPWRNVYDTSAHYVGMQTCRGCHQSIYETFIQTGMGQSFGLANKEKSAADFAPAHALVYDSALDYYYKPYWDHDSFYIMEEIGLTKDRMEQLRAAMDARDKDRIQHETEILNDVSRPFAERVMDAALRDAMKGKKVI